SEQDEEGGEEEEEHSGEPAHEDL
ncbi:unnamed protein product, partial [Rotaria magnacalcarata]